MSLFKTDLRNTECRRKMFLCFELPSEKKFKSRSFNYINYKCRGKSICQVNQIKIFLSKVTKLFISFTSSLL